MSVVAALGALCLALGGLGLLYTLVLAMVAGWGRPPRPRAVPARIAVLVPAHDEERWIGGLLSDLAAQSRPADAVVVVADRCSDDTARTARGAGAEVVELAAGPGGKGRALVAGFEALSEREWDVVVVLDADCRLAPGFLASVRGGRNEVVQAVYTLHAGNARGLVFEYAARLENALFHAGRARLGLPAFLRGTGMILGRDALRAVPWSGAGLTEDRDQGLRFLAGGVPVRYDLGVEVVSDLPPGRREVWEQRRRWSSTGIGAGVAAALRAVPGAWTAAGARALELPLAVLADARSQWLVLLGLGFCLDAVARGRPRVSLALFLAGILLAVILAGFVWYGRRFWRVLARIPESAAVSVGSAGLALVGRRPRSWVRGRRS
jgi:1,2-diacylglycerol 3-beta-glucosyltransferase